MFKSVPKRILCYNFCGDLPFFAQIQNLRKILHKAIYFLCTTTEICLRQKMDEPCTFSLWILSEKYHFNAKSNFMLDLWSTNLSSELSKIRQKVSKNVITLCFLSLITMYWVKLHEINFHWRISISVNIFPLEVFDFCVLLCSIMEIPYWYYLFHIKMSVMMS